MEVITLEQARRDRESGKIDVSTLKKNTTKLESGLIAPAKKEVAQDIVQEHDAEPIKRMEDIFRISQYYISRGKYRDNMMFIVGINFGLRFSDLRRLRFADLINPNLTFKDSFAVFEQKTRNTRKKKKNRYITINQAVIEAVTLYLEHTPNVSLSDYMFRSESKKDRHNENPIDIRSANRILEKTAKDLDLNIRLSTHSFRKTFGYHQMMMSDNSDRKLLLLQKMFNHSSPAQTLDYIGITSEEIEEEYKRLNLGSEKYNYLVNSQVYETDSKMA